MRDCAIWHNYSYTVTSPLVPGLVTEADTLEEVLPHVADALAALLALYEDLGAGVTK